MSQSSNHLRLVSWTWQLVHFTQMGSTVTRSQSNRAPLGCCEREIHIMDVQPTNLQQLCDAIMSIWTKISDECFQHLVESMPRRIKAVLKVQPGTSKVYLIKWPVTVYHSLTVLVNVTFKRGKSMSEPFYSKSWQLFYFPREIRSHISTPVPLQFISNFG